MSLEEALKNYSPYNEQEKKDKEAMLQFMHSSNQVYSRENTIAHFSASSWLVNKDRSKVVMIYHNLYDSWAWTGGHADGEEDLLQVAIKEAKEETGLQKISVVSPEIFSIEMLTVDGHVKRGAYVSSHLHMNITYLLEAEEDKELVIKPDENSGVTWFSLEDAIEACSEPWMKQIYLKLNEKLRNI